MSVRIGGLAYQAYERARWESAKARMAAQQNDGADHDPGDEDRRPTGPWCSRCGDAFDGPERDCPNPAPGRPYVDCGRGGHIFDRSDRP